MRVNPTLQAALSYSTRNIGDDIQSLAAQKYSSLIDLFIDRDKIGEYPQLQNKKARIILNGWFIGNAESWPPADSFCPLFISFHLASHQYIENAATFSTDKLLSSECLDYYRRNGPIGCRDKHTLKTLQLHDVPSYYSGCLTLTFPKVDIPRTDRVLLVDPISSEASGGGEKFLEEIIPTHIKNQVDIRSHHINPNMSTTERMLKAQSLLDEYQAAHLVITSRLHCALPCVSFGTPVLFVEPMHDRTRLDGPMDYVHYISYADLRADKSSYDWDRPPANPGCPNHIRKTLITDCQRFMRTGIKPRI